MRPVVFDGTMGWLSDAGGSRGVVIAGSHGFEDLCSRRFLTLLARRIASDGFPVLQFDYPGCGDAAGGHSDPGRVAAWTLSLEHAIDALKAETGVADVVLIGFRLGALLATPVIGRRDDVAGLALLAPPASGKTFVREQVALSRMIDGALPPSPTVEPAFDGLQVAGFRLSNETLGDLRALDPFCEPLGDGRAGRVLVMGRNDIGVAENLAAKLGREDRPADADLFTGYDRLMCDPTAGQIPDDVIERCAAWVRSAPGEAARSIVAARQSQDRMVGPDYEEEPVVIGPAPQMAGVLCRPRGHRHAAEALIILNAGGVPHVGWARGSVEVARSLAANGVASLRLDLPGLGQSEAPGEKRVRFYDVRTRADTIRAVDWMLAAGFERIGLVGNCSGGFQAFHAARADPRIASITMVNPLCFDWNSSYALDMTVWKASKITFGAGRAFGQDDRTGGLGELGSFAAPFARNAIRRSLELVKSGLSRVSPATLIGGRPVERWMRQIVQRGTTVVVVNSEGDLSLEEVARHFGPGGGRLRAMTGVTMHLVPAADHTLTPLHARRALAGYLADLVRTDRPRQPASPRRRKTGARPRAAGNVRA